MAKSSSKRIHVLPNRWNPCDEDYAALGLYIANCSTLEICLHAILRDLLAIDEDIARLIVGEDRTRNLTDFISKIAVLKMLPNDFLNDLDNALKWVGYCYRIRAVIAHKPFLITDSMLTFHNTVTAKRKETSWKYQCTLEELKNAAIFVDSISGEILRAGRKIKKTVEITTYPHQKGALKALLQKLTLPADPVSMQDPSSK